MISAGAILGQGVIIASMPIVTRLYTPIEMGLYAVFVAFIGIFSTPIALHYELAVPLPKRDAEAARVAILGLLVSAVASAVLGLGIYAARDPLLALFNAGALRGFIWLVPLGLALSGGMNVLTTWAVRNKAFRASALANLAQGVGQSAPQVGAGLVHAGIGGLIAGQILGIVAACAALAGAGVPSVRQKTGRTVSVRLWVVARKYRRFALITVWSSLVNALAAQVPVIMLSSLFGAFAAGQFALSFRLLQIPSRLIGQSISRVFFAHAAEASRSGDLAALVSKIFRGIFSFGLPSFVLVACVAPAFFRVVFGNRWVDAGYFTQLLMPWVFFSFISGALGILVSVLQKQAEELALQVVYLVVVVFSLMFGYAYESPWAAMAALGILGGVYFCGKICWLLLIAGARVRSDLKFCLRECLITLPPAVGLLWLSRFVQSDILVTLSGALALILVHISNYQLRGVYSVMASDVTTPELRG
jgi:lipopolysaccharide exporter